MELTLKEKIELTTGDKAWHNRSLKGKVPRVHLSDGPNGLRKQYDDAKSNNDSVKATCFPTASAVASSFNPKMAALMADGIAKEAFNEDVSVLLGPGICMKRSPLCGRNFEYYSEDPYLSGKMGIAFVSAVEKRGIGVSVKHFACNNQETKRMTSNSEVDKKALREIYLKAFEMVIKNTNAATVMASYNRLNGIYSCENKWLLTDVLKKEWGFKGVVVSDWGACTNLTKSIKAGMDLEMPDSKKAHTRLVNKDYKKGLITEEEITASATNVYNMATKYDVAKREYKGKCDISDNHKRVVEIETESAVLLENDGILPLKEKDITIVGSLAENVRYQGGGSSHIHTENLKTAMAALETEGYKVTYYKGYNSENNKVDEKLEEEVLSAITKKDTVLFFGGLTDIIEGEGYDRTSLSMPENQISLLDKLLKKNKNIIFISFGGSAYDMYFAKDVRALLDMHLGGEGVMEAMAELVSGKVSPSGKLSETYPYKLEDTPANGYFATGSKDVRYKESIFIGYRYYDTFAVPVRYPFGYGKTYTTFEYSAIEAPDTYTSGKLDITYKIKNTGEVDAKEISEVYISSLSDKYLHPLKELKGFAKTLVKKGEETIVTVTLDEEAFKVFDAKTDKYVIPSGKYKILVGASCQDIKLEKEITVTGSEYICEYDKNYFAKERKLKNITDEEWEHLLGRPIDHFDDVKKGNYSVTNSLQELARASFGAKVLLKFATKAIYHMFKGKPKDDPEVRMFMSVLTEGTLDALVLQSGFLPYHLAEAIVLSANGHKIKAFFKAIF